MTVEIKRLGTHEVDRFQGLLQLFGEVFEMTDFTSLRPEYLQTLLERGEFVAFVALSEGKVIGGLTAYIMQQYYSEIPLAYIFDLAVKAEFQRKRVGKQLMSAIIDYGREQGWEEIFVQADYEDQHALDFYRATGGNPEQVVHFTYPLTVGRERKNKSPTGTQMGASGAKHGFRKIQAQKRNQSAWGGLDARGNRQATR